MGFPERCLANVCMSGLLQNKGKCGFKMLQLFLNNTPEECSCYNKKDFSEFCLIHFPGELNYIRQRYSFCSHMSINKRHYLRTVQVLHFQWSASVTFPKTQNRKREPEQNTCRNSGREWLARHLGQEGKRTDDPQSDPSAASSNPLPAPTQQQEATIPISQ